MALNKVFIMGRITHDLEVKRTPGGSEVLSFTVAVDRYSKSEEKQADFISCVAWKERAEFIARYFGKGRMICVEGTLRTRTYEDKHGTKHYVTEVFVDNANFTGEPRETHGNGPQSGFEGSQGSYTPQATNAPQAAAQGQEMNLDDFEDVLSDDGVPF